MLRILPYAKKTKTIPAIDSHNVARMSSLKPGVIKSKSMVSPYIYIYYTDNKDPRKIFTN